MNDLPLRKNPSREQCETIIRRILVTEVSERGRNEHFKQATDFMSYFQSLYPASEALTKQVQRAVKSMNMPKDEHGCYVVNKTHEQLEQEQELKYLFQKGSPNICFLSDCEPVLLKIAPPVRAHLMDALSHSITFEGDFETIAETNNGILFYTMKKDRLLAHLNSLIPDIT